MNQGDRCLVVHGGVEVEGVVKSHHRELDQVLVAVHKACGGYFEILRSPQDVRLVSGSRPASVEWKAGDSSDTEELEEVGQSVSAQEDTRATPMDLDSEERDTAVFLASLSSTQPPARFSNPDAVIPPASSMDREPFSNWSSPIASQSAPTPGFIVGSLPTGRPSEFVLQARPTAQPQKTPVQPPSQPPPTPASHLQKELQKVSGEDVDTITRIMEISLNASSPPSGPQYRPIVYLATSPTVQLEESDGTQGVLLTARTGSGLTAHTVSRPINIPVRRPREIPVSGLHGSPRRTHIAHFVLSDPGVLPASLSSSTSSSAALGSVPTQLGSFSPPSCPGPGLLPPGSGSSAPLSGRRVRSDVKKCRKVYGIEHRDQWCNQCRWKKACTRFPDPTSPPKHG